MLNIDVIAKQTAIGRVFLYVASLMVVLVTGLNAQTITGRWQGTLPIPVNPRIVLKIAKADDGSLRGVFYQIDHDDSSIPFSSVTFVAPDLSVAADLVDTSYRGKLSADGKSVNGTWTQGIHSYPLTFVLATPDTVWKHDSGTSLPPMSATADPAFEVATIRPSPPDETQRSFALRTRHFAAKNSTVADLIKFAYQVRDRQISGAPSWINETRFDIAAEPGTQGLPSEDQDRLMLKKLLTDRFHLTVHSIQQIFPVYALTVEGSPPKLLRSDPGFNSHGRIFVKEEANDQMQEQFSFMAMPEFANILMNFIRERQIVDETGLTGVYDFTLTVPASLFQGGLDDNERAAIVIRAVHSLGFKLVPKKAPLEVIVIDHLETPSAN